MISLLIVLVSLLQVSESFLSSSLRVSTKNYKIDTPQVASELLSSLRIKSFTSTSLFAGETTTQGIQAEGSGSPCRIKVVGVGGGGGNAVNRMVESGTAVLGVEMWTVNTDAQALSRSLAPNKLNIGVTTSR